MAWCAGGSCDLIVRLHEEFGLSVSDDTIYRALKDLGFSHVSARPNGLRQSQDLLQWSPLFALRDCRQLLPPMPPK